jgi:hypothetical protein
MLKPSFVGFLGAPQRVAVARPFAGCARNHSVFRDLGAPFEPFPFKGTLQGEARAAHMGRVVQLQGPLAPGFFRPATKGQCRRYAIALQAENRAKKGVGWL